MRSGHHREALHKYAHPGRRRLIVALVVLLYWISVVPFLVPPNRSIPGFLAAGLFWIMLFGLPFRSYVGTRGDTELVVQGPLRRVTIPVQEIDSFRTAARGERPTVFLRSEEPLVLYAVDAPLFGWFTNRYGQQVCDELNDWLRALRAG